MMYRRYVTTALEQRYLSSHPHRQAPSHHQHDKTILKVTVSSAPQEHHPLVRPASHRQPHQHHQHPVFPRARSESLEDTRYSSHHQAISGLKLQRHLNPGRASMERASTRHTHSEDGGASRDAGKGRHLACRLVRRSPINQDGHTGQSQSCIPEAVRSMQVKMPGS